MQIVGHVFVDTNGDGKWESAEKTLGGVTISLTPGNKTTTTDSTGQYIFPLTTPGTYTVAIQVPTGFALTTAPSLTSTVTATNILGQKNFGVEPTAQPATQFPDQPTAKFYVDSVNGSDTNKGDTPQTAFKSIKVVDNAEVLLIGQTYNISHQIDFGGHVNAWIASSDPTKPAIIQTQVAGGFLTNWNTNSTNCGLRDLVVDSLHGDGTVGNIRGTGCKIINIGLKNLAEGFDYVQCVDLYLSGGSQIGSVAGRCHYFLDVTGNSQWIGDPTKQFGPASKQSPIRFSSPGWIGGTIENVTVSQVSSNFPIACAAIHCLKNCQMSNFKCIGGEWSIDGAGAGIGDEVSGCTFTNITTVETKLAMKQIGFNNTFVNPICENSSGECISLDLAAVSGNKIQGGTLTSPNGKHLIEFYTACDIVISGIKGIAPVGTKIMNGAFTAKNDGGGNVVTVS